MPALCSLVSPGAATGLPGRKEQSQEDVSPLSAAELGVLVLWGSPGAGSTWGSPSTRVGGTFLPSPLSRRPQGQAAACGRKEPHAAVDVYFKKTKSYTGNMTVILKFLKNTEVTEITPSCARIICNRRGVGAGVCTQGRKGEPHAHTSPGGAAPPRPPCLEAQALALRPSTHPPELGPQGKSLQLSSARVKKQQIKPAQSWKNAPGDPPQAARERRGRTGGSRGRRERGCFGGLR